MKPATSHLLGGLVAILVATALAAVGVVWLTHQAAQTRRLQHLQGAAQVESALQSMRLEILQLQARGLATDPGFVGYVAHALIPNPGLGGAVDAASISDLLQQHHRDRTVTMVLDPHGEPVAVAGILLRDRATIATDALVARSLARKQPAQGVWVEQGELLWVTVNPLMRGGTLQGLLLTATVMDNAFANSVSRVADADVAFVSRNQSGAVSTASAGLNSRQKQALAARARDILAVDDAQGSAMRLETAEHATMAWVTPLVAADGRAALVAVDPAWGVHPVVARSAWPLFGGIAILALLAMLRLLVQWRRTWLPLQAMADVLERAAAGDHFLEVRASGSAIVRRLRDCINRLLVATGPK